MRLNIIAAGISFISIGVMAEQPNTVKFMGEVSTQTCSVSINGVDESPVILLPTVPATKFTAKGSTAGTTAFTLDLTGCATDVIAVGRSDTGVKGSFIANSVSADKNLANSGTATNVSIRLLDIDGTKALVFNKGVVTKTSGVTKPANATTVSIPLSAQYYAEAASVGAGTVIAGAQYAISYQ